MALLCKKNKKEEGPTGASPVAAPMPKSVSERKDILLRGRMYCVCLRAFHRWGGLVFIVDVLLVGW